MEACQQLDSGCHTQSSSWRCHVQHVLRCAMQRAAPLRDCCRLCTKQRLTPYRRRIHTHTRQSLASAACPSPLPTQLLIWGPIAFGLGAALFRAATGTVNFSTTTNTVLSVVLIVMPVTWGFRAYMALKEKQRAYQVGTARFVMVGWLLVQFRCPGRMRVAGPAGLGTCRRQRQRQARAVAPARAPAQAYLNKIFLLHNLNNNAGVISQLITWAQEQVGCSLTRAH